jgi:hypothetical protein
VRSEKGARSQDPARGTGCVGSSRGHAGGVSKVIKLPSDGLSAGQSAGGMLMRMAGDGELTFSRMRGTALWGTALCVLATIGTGIAAGLGVPERNDWTALSMGLGLTVCLTTTVSLRRRLEAGPNGLRFRTAFRWSRLEWDEIAGFEERRVGPGDRRLSAYHLRAVATLRNGDAVWLPLPYVRAQDAFSFEDDLRALRAARRRYTT